MPRTRLADVLGFIAYNAVVGGGLPDINLLSNALRDSAVEEPSSEGDGGLSKGQPSPAPPNGAVQTLAVQGTRPHLPGETPQTPRRREQTVLVLANGVDSDRQEKP